MSIPDHETLNDAVLAGKTAQPWAVRYGTPEELLAMERRVALDNAIKATNPKDAVGVRKAPMSAVPANVMAEVGLAMLEGACKYGRHNYREAGVRSSVYYDGVMRHLMSWWEGEDIDPDSALSHITKAITSLVVLRDAMHQGMWTDDRPPSSKPFYPELNRLAGEIIDRYADRNPTHYTKDRAALSLEQQPTATATNPMRKPITPQPPGY